MRSQAELGNENGDAATAKIFVSPVIARRKTGPTPALSFDRPRGVPVSLAAIGDAAIPVGEGQVRIEFEGAGAIGDDLLAVVVAEGNGTAIGVGGGHRGSRSIA